MVVVLFFVVIVEKHWFAGSINSNFDLV